jgi:hypothetical protein
MHQETLHKYAIEGTEVTIHLKGGLSLAGKISPISEWEHSDEVKMHQLASDSGLTNGVAHFNLCDIILLEATETQGELSP